MMDIYIYIMESHVFVNIVEYTYLHSIEIKIWNMIVDIVYYA